MKLEELLANCEREQLHLSGKVQSFGALLCVDEDTLLITHVSANIGEYIATGPEEILGRSLNQLDWFPQDALLSLENRAGNRKVLADCRLSEEKRCHLRLLRGQGFFIIELEPCLGAQIDRSYHELEQSLYPPPGETWQESEYFDRLLATLREILPFQRLMLYRFEEDWVGEVVAELTTDAPNLYLGLKFPASDIPAIARTLYFENPSRVIPDVDAPAVDIVSFDGEAPNLTWSDLRSVSPVHLQYLKNMSVGASYSIPLIVSGKLWGIVACHHPQGFALDATQRQMAESLVRHFCSVFANFRSKGRLALLNQVDQWIRNLHTEMTTFDDDDARYDYLLNAILQQFRLSSVALRADNQWYQSGEELAESSLMLIDRHLVNDFSDYIFATQDVTQLVPAPELRAPEVRGVMAIKLSFERHAPRLYLFRQPESQTTYWAGNPDKLAQQDNGQGALSPRASFDKWTEVRGEQAPPWSNSEQLKAKKLRLAMFKHTIRVG